MDIIIKIRQIMLEKEIIKAIPILLKKDHNQISQLKKDLRKNHGIVCINVMQDIRSQCLIMIKTEKSTYIYIYDKEKNILKIKGGRDNVNSK